MNNHLFGISAVISSVALLIFSIGETFAYPQGPNVSLGANPIVTLSCFGHPHYQNVYQVPTGMTLVITDFHIGSDTNGYIRVGASSVLVTRTISYVTISIMPVLHHMSFSSGITVAEGLYVQCSAGNDGSFAAGYLVPFLRDVCIDIGYEVHMIVPISTSKPKTFDLDIWNPLALTVLTFQS